jgi:hypothetical protein
VLVFGWLGVPSARRLLDRRPALVLDADRLHDNTSPVRWRLIRWPEITAWS